MTRRTFPPPVRPNDWPVIGLQRDMALECKRMADEMGLTLGDFVRALVDYGIESGWADLNRRPPAPEAGALPS